MTSPVSIPTIPSYQPLALYERSISTGKTQRVQDVDGLRFVKIIDGSDGNQDVLDKVVRVVRYEFSGGKTIFLKCLQVGGDNHASHTSSVLLERKRLDIFCLSDEVLVEILKYLPINELMRAKQLNKKFYDIIESYSDKIGQKSHCAFVASKLAKLNFAHVLSGKEDAINTMFAQVKIPMTDEKRRAVADELFAEIEKESIPLAVDFYTQRFNLKELLEVYKFNSSPTGKKIALQVPQLTALSIECATAINRRILGKHFGPLYFMG
jgi:hypothetical protein